MKYLVIYSIILFVFLYSGIIKNPDINIIFKITPFILLLIIKIIIETKKTKKKP